MNFSTLEFLVWKIKEHHMEKNRFFKKHFLSPNFPTVGRLLPLHYYKCLLMLFSHFFCRFLGSEDPNTFFSRAQRSRMVYEILATTPFGKEKKGEVGIERMVEEGAYSAAFPLHDVSLFFLLHKKYKKLQRPNSSAS